MSYHKKHREWFYEVGYLTFCKYPEYGKFKNILSFNNFTESQKIPKLYKLCYCSDYKNPIFVNNYKNIITIQKILNRVY